MANIHIPKPWEFKNLRITDESAYNQRRNFIKQLAALGLTSMVGAELYAQTTADLDRLELKGPVMSVVEEFYNNYEKEGKDWEEEPDRTRETTFNRSGLYLSQSGTRKGKPQGKLTFEYA